MSYTPKASQEYLKNAVMTATPEQLQLMLYDGAIRFATQGVDAVQRRDFEAAYNALSRAQKIVVALHDGLKREVNPGLVDQMSALYAFVFRRLVDCNINRDVTAGEDAVRILRHQRETWVLLMDKLAAHAGAIASAAGQTPQAAGPADAPVSVSLEC